MPTLEEIQANMKQLDSCSKFFGRKEIKELPHILWDDELLEHIVQGSYNNGNGILVATNKRLIFIDKGLMWGLKVEDFPYDKISSIQYETGLLLADITIFSSGNKADIKNVPNDQCRNFCEYVRARISSIKNPANIANEENTSAQKPDFIANLERLAALKSQGILSEDEFNIAKKKLLS